MSISFSCPSCKTAFVAPPKFAGTRVPCKKCSAVCDVPEDVEKVACEVLLAKELPPSSSRHVVIPIKEKAATWTVASRQVAVLPSPSHSSWRVHPSLYLVIGTVFVLCVWASLTWMGNRPVEQKAPPVPAPAPILAVTPPGRDDADLTKLREKLEAEAKERDERMILAHAEMTAKVNEATKKANEAREKLELERILTHRAQLLQEQQKLQEKLNPRPIELKATIGNFLIFRDWKYSQKTNACLSNMRASIVGDKLVLQFDTDATQWPKQSVPDNAPDICNLYISLLDASDKHLGSFSTSSIFIPAAADRWNWIRRATSFKNIIALTPTDNYLVFTVNQRDLAFSKHVWVGFHFGEGSVGQ